MRILLLIVLLGLVCCTKIDNKPIKYVYSYNKINYTVHSIQYAKYQTYFSTHNGKVIEYSLNGKKDLIFTNVGDTLFKTYDSKIDGMDTIKYDFTFHINYSDTSVLDVRYIKCYINNIKPDTTYESYKGIREDKFFINH